MLSDAALLDFLYSCGRTCSLLICDSFLWFCYFLSRMIQIISGFGSTSESLVDNQLQYYFSFSKLVEKLMLQNLGDNHAIHSLF